MLLLWLTIVQYSVAPSTGDPHALQYAERQTMNCVEITVLYIATIWSVLATAGHMCWASLVHVMRRVMLLEAASDWNN